MTGWLRLCGTALRWASGSRIPHPGAYMYVRRTPRPFEASRSAVCFWAGPPGFSLTRSHSSTEIRSWLYSTSSVQIHSDTGYDFSTIESYLSTNMCIRHSNCLFTGLLSPQCRITGCLRPKVQSRLGIGGGSGGFPHATRRRAVPQRGWWKGRASNKSSQKIMYISSYDQL